VPVGGGRRSLGDVVRVGRKALDCTCTDGRTDKRHERRQVAFRAIARGDLFRRRGHADADAVPALPSGRAQWSSARVLATAVSMIGRQPRWRLGAL
jgi:hypothetical protein